MVDLAQKYDLHSVLEHQSRDDISIDKLEVSCPGNRFNECTNWEKFNVSCYVSRAFQMLCDKVLYRMDWASSSEIEEIREIVEKKFKVRMLSVIDAVNTSRDNIQVCKKIPLCQQKERMPRVPVACHDGKIFLKEAANRTVVPRLLAWLV